MKGPKVIPIATSMCIAQIANAMGFFYMILFQQKKMRI
jgi:hypothetical protein